MNPFTKLFGFYLRHERKDKATEDYEKLEQIVLEMIEATTNSRAEAEERVRQFRRDFPPPVGRTE
jgi:hypothetical protein